MGLCLLCCFLCGRASFVVSNRIRTSSLVPKQQPRHPFHVPSIRGGGFSLSSSSSTVSVEEDETEEPTVVDDDEEETTDDEDEVASPAAVASSSKKTNPLWPDGISKDDIDILVDDILADPSINVPAIPDVLERQIYRSTTVLTLNAVYRIVGGLHGKTILGHELAIARLRRDESRSQRMRQEQLLRMKSDVDEDLLEEVADRLLSNKNINQPLIPDVAERAIYISCLKIVFRILNMLAASFRVTVCGHDFTLSLEKAILSRPDMIQAARTAASSATAIDSKFLRRLARETAAVAAGEELQEKKWWKKSLIKASKREFIIQLHAVLYSLILGILDDLLANTELVLMSDRIQFDIVAKDAAGKQSFLTKAKNRVAARRNKRLEEEAAMDEDESDSDSDSDGDTKVVEEVSTIATFPDRKQSPRLKQRLVPFVLGIAVGAVGSMVKRSGIFLF